jgi:prepilin-type N-terminal cleavage/methylation domain-containing protein
MKNPQAFPKLAHSRNAFSIIELLTVVAVMGVLTALIAPVFTGSFRDMTVAADSISDVLQQARTRAMSKNTYVYVGLSRTDSLTPELAVAVIESRAGLASKTNDLTDATSTAGLQAIRRATFLRGVELDTSVAGSNLAAGSLQQSSGRAENVETSLIRFPADLVTQRGNIAGSEFEWVIQFSPDGAARLDATERTVPGYIVLGFVPAAGDAANAAGVVIDGPSGAVRVVRPGA